MGLMTMKGMFKNHDKEVAAVEELFAKTVEESFDAFTDRVLPEDQKRKYAPVQLCKILTLSAPF